jgi:hypothetical protein
MHNGHIRRSERRNLRKLLTRGGLHEVDSLPELKLYPKTPNAPSPKQILDTRKKLLEALRTDLSPEEIRGAIKAVGNLSYPPPNRHREIRRKANQERLREAQAIGDQKAIDLAEDIIDMQETIFNMDWKEPFPLGKQRISEQIKEKHTEIYQQLKEMEREYRESFTSPDTASGMHTNEFFWGIEDVVPQNAFIEIPYTVTNARPSWDT